MNTKARKRFLELARAKYDRGQAAHGGLLTERDLLAEQEEEVIDLWHYFQAGEMARQGLPALSASEIRERSLARWSALTADRCRARLGGKPMRYREVMIISLWSDLQAERAGAGLWAARGTNGREGRKA